MDQSELRARMTTVAETVNSEIDHILSDACLPHERERPARLLAAMRHGTLNGGKRVRPFLVVETAALFDVPMDHALRTACALECLHSYSLVHDDLPAMDDDDLRRGQPTVHKAFDEATAILAGDALLTLSFDLLADPSCHPDPNARSQLVLLLARAGGLGGMIGGQMLDLAAEKEAPGEAEIRTLQAMKTGALIRYACQAGAVLGKARDSEMEALTRYGEIIGLAFQLADDLLDVTSSSDAMGKAVGKDADRGKGTLVAIHGPDAIRTMLDDLVAEAGKALEPFGEKGQALQAIARYIAIREN